jgi:hypothetical protein
VTEPTLAEATRRFEEATKRLSGEMAELTREMREERRTNAETYVRRDVYASDTRAYEAEHREMRNDIAAIEKAREVDQNWRRNVSLALAITVLGSLTSIGLAIFAYITR